jgi:cell division protein FtsW
MVTLAANRDDERAFWQEAMLFAVLTLLGVGLVMSLSLDGPVRGLWPALSGRAGRLLIGLLGYFLVRRLTAERLRPMVLPLFVFVLGLCLMPRLLGVGTKGACRWIPLGSLSFQPVELLKVVCVLAMAEMLERRRPQLTSFWHGVLPVVCVPAAAAAVLLLQPDVGHAFFVMGICGVLLLVGGVSFLHCTALSLTGAVALAGALSMFGHTRARLAEFRSGEPGHQISRGLWAFAEGGVGGVGPGESWLKLGYLPEARNDFILAIVGNELGLVGSVIVVGMFVLFAVAALRMVRRAPTRWSLLAGLGLTLTIVLQACLNVLGVTHTIPEKGIDLPFLSSGGTNLVFALVSVGMLVGVTGGGATSAAGGAEIGPSVREAVRVAAGRVRVR